MEHLQLTEQELLRRESLQEIIRRGIDPFPAESWPITHKAQKIHAQFEDGKAGLENVSLAGRLMSRRIMGKASFCELQDSSGRIQLYITRDDICPGEDKSLYNDFFKKLLDLGDIIEVKGFVFRTQMGEVTIHVKELKLLSKSLKPLPVVKEKDGVK